MRRGAPRAVWLAIVAVLGGGLGAAHRAEARFFLTGEVLRGVNLVATVAVEGAGEQTQRRSATPLPFDPEPFTRELRLVSSDPLGETAAASVHTSTFEEDSTGERFEGSSCSGGELITAIDDPDSDSTAGGSVESFYELNFRIEDEPEPFALRFRLQSELAEFTGSAGNEMMPRALLVLEETVNELPLVESTRVDRAADGIVLDDQGWVSGVLMPGVYRLEAAVEVLGAASSDASADGRAIYEVAFAVPEPGVGLGLLATAAALGLRRAQSSPRARRVRSSCSR